MKTEDIKSPHAAGRGRRGRRGLPARGDRVDQVIAVLNEIAAVARMTERVADLPHGPLRMRMVALLYARTDRLAARTDALTQAPG